MLCLNKGGFGPLALAILLQMVYLFDNELRQCISLINMFGREGRHKIPHCRSFSVLKILTGYRPFCRSLYYFPSKFPSVIRGNHTNSIRATSLKFIYHIYKKLNITALQNCLNWCLIRDMVGQVNVVFHCRFSNLSCSADHNRKNFLKLGR